MMRVFIMHAQASLLSLPLREWQRENTSSLTKPLQEQAMAGNSTLSH